MMHLSQAFSDEEVIELIIKNHPVMDIYTEGNDVPLRIDSMKFNYNCLGDKNKKSAAQNFPFIMGLIKKESGSVIIDAAFGENVLPFLKLPAGNEKRSFLQSFGIYSRFVYLAWSRGIYDKAPHKSITEGIALLSPLSGAMIAGPYIDREADKGNKEMSNKAYANKSSTKLPPPPAKGKVSRSGFFSALRFNGISLSSDPLISLKTLGPPWLFYPLAVMTIASFFAAKETERAEFISTGFFSAGLILFMHSFVLLRRKRIMENCPRSKIRSMPMGEVEVGGYARQKYYLKTPFSLTDCVYYSYKIYEKVQTKDGPREILREWGSSDNIPFYLEDDTGKTLVLPEGATLNAGRTESVRGSLVSRMLGAGFSSDSRRIVETAVAPGSFLYVIGFAHRLKESGKERRKQFIERVRALKRDSHRMKRYDTNKDGKIGEEEWETAKRDIDQEMLKEKLASQKKADAVAIGSHPSGGLFFITDKKEYVIVRSLAWRVPLFLFTAISVIIGSVYSLLKLPALQAIFLK